MPIEIACPKCHRRMRAPDTSAGRKVKCLVCQEPIEVPGGEQPAPTKAANPATVAPKTATPAVKATNPATPASKTAPTAAPKSAPATPAATPQVKKSAPSPAATPAKPLMPLAEPKTTQASPAASTPKPKPKPAIEEKWTLMTEDDQEFGPVPRSELDSWFKEGLITAKCQVLKEGGAEWQFATQLYPALKPTKPSAPTATASTPAKPTKPTKPTKPSAPTSSGLQPLQPLDDGPLSLSPLGGANPFGSASPLDLQPLNTSSPLELQPLGGGPMSLQPLAELQPMAAAPTPAALMAPAPYVAPAAKPTAWGTPSRTAFVSWAGMVCMAAGAAYVIRALLWAVNTTTVFASRPQFTPEHARTAAAVAMVVGAVGVLFALIVAIPYGLAGFAILGRKNWGKILGVVCGGFSCLVGLFFLFTLFRELNNYVNFARFVPLPMSFHLRLLGGILFDAIFVGLLVAQAAMAFMLLGERRSHEFR